MGASGSKGGRARDGEGAITDRNAEKDLDQQLIARFKAGSMEAMEEIVRRYERPLFNFGLKICGQCQDAEDVIQETFLNAFRYLNGFRGETKLKNWLFKIASRTCLRKRRKRKGEPEEEVPLEDFELDAGANSGYEIPSWSDDPSGQLLRAELKRIIDLSIQSLPQKYRLVFNLRDLQGFNTQETAEILEISPEAVKTRLHRARLFLRKKISALYREARAK